VPDISRGLGDTRESRERSLGRCLLPDEQLEQWRVLNHGVSHASQAFGFEKRHCSLDACLSSDARGIATATVLESSEGSRDIVGQTRSEFLCEHAGVLQGE